MDAAPLLDDSYFQAFELSEREKCSCLATILAKGVTTQLSRKAVVKELLATSGIIDARFSNKKAPLMVVDYQPGKLKIEDLLKMISAHGDQAWIVS